MEQVPERDHGAADEWLLHIDEPTRALARETVAQVADKLAACMDPVWEVDARGDLTLVVADAAIIGRPRPATLTLSQDGLTIRVPGPSSRASDYLQISDDLRSVATYTAPTERALAKLRAWHAGLGRSLDCRHAGELDSFRRERQMLAHGLIYRSQLPDVAWLTRQLSRWGASALHIITAASYDEGLSYTTCGSDADLVMSKALADELSRLARDRVHVSDQFNRGEALPVIQIGSPRQKTVFAPEHSDPVEIMRALRAFPPQFTLDPVHRT